ncbi:MAG: transglutaminase-like domain-containing protein, partial [Candidatus Poribacteria bacterium]|nr:transglutaminase-like domain-containing protein [Candidatus Poribacteria bacterium]
GSRLRITINDQTTVLFEEPAEREYWTDCWTRIPIPVEALRPGLNRFVFAADGDETWGFLIEQSRLPNRSAKSRDGGRNWDDERLGVNDASDGEYMIRLKLDGHAACGVMESPVIDLGTRASEDGIAVPFDLYGVRFNLDADKPTSTRIQLRCRLGSTPEYELATWTDWIDAVVGQPMQVPLVPRYLQWQMTLRTDNPRHTPCVEGLEISVEVDVDETEDQLPLQITGWHVPEVSRGSHRFSYLPYETKRAEVFRNRWKLEDVIAGATSEFDRFVRLSAWTRHQWEDGWNMGEIDFCPPWDGMVILELASRQLSLGMCTHYTTVFVHACAALGLIARTVVIGCHCVAEVWSEEYDRWVMIDTGGDSNDETKATYYYARNGVPMSALDIHNASVRQDFDGVAIEPEHAAKRFENDLISRARLFERFCIQLRNDELRTLSPGEPEHGSGSYHYDGYLWWKDEQMPPHPWFSRHSGRGADFYWTPNRTEIHLSRSDHPEVLHVDFCTTMPNLKHYLAQVGDEDWEPQTEGFGWKLRRGENHLRVKATSKFGWEGKESHVVVRFDE